MSRCRHAAAIADHVTATGHFYDHFYILAKGTPDTHYKNTLLIRDLKSYPK